MITLPPISAPAPSATGTVAPAHPAAPATAVQAVGLADATAGGHQPGLADHREPPPRPAERRKPLAAPAHAPVVALMRQAEAVVRIANRAGTDSASRPEGYGLAVAQAPGGLQVSGQLIVEGEAGLEIGSGRIYRSGELVAAFTGPNLAFVGGQMDRLV